MEHCPPHFSQVRFDLYTNEKDIADWIWTNLSGRFFLGDIYFHSEIEKTGLEFGKVAGFELSHESSYFALMLPTINILHL